MSHALAHVPHQQVLPVKRPLPLASGDRLTREEFERRFDATPTCKFAELIEGTVYMPPPVSHEFHSGPHADFNGFFWLYRSLTPGIIAGDNGSLRLDLDNMPQPDAYLMLPRDKGGQARIDEDGYVAGAPELIGEIAGSSASIDLHLKMKVYRRNGVREYIVWRTYDAEIDYFILRQGEFVPMSPDASDGLFKSVTFPDLWLDRSAMLRRDLSGVSAAVQKGAASPQHADFLARLSGAKPRRK